jgi:hypothetical protein
MKLFVFVLLIIVQINATAQGVKPTKPAVAKTKVPTIKATIAGVGSGTYSPAVAKIMIDSNLVLKDESGKKYPIYKCSFLYKRRMEYKDDESGGDVKTSWEYLENVLKNNAQLDDLWRKTIKNDLKKGEQLIFENILADSQKGYMIQVKSIILTIQ